MNLTAERDLIVSHLRRRRKCLGLSQWSLAGQIGIHRRLLQQWEAGCCNATLGHLIQWARALDCEVVIR